MSNTSVIQVCLTHVRPTRSDDTVPVRCPDAVKWNLKTGLGQAVGYGYSILANTETYKEFTHWTGADEHSQYKKSGEEHLQLMKS